MWELQKFYSRFIYYFMQFDVRYYLIWAFSNHFHHKSCKEDTGHFCLYSTALALICCYYSSSFQLLFQWRALDDLVFPHYLKLMVIFPISYRAVWDHWNTTIWTWLVTNTDFDKEKQKLFPVTRGHISFV